MINDNSRIPPTKSINFAVNSLPIKALTFGAICDILNDINLKIINFLLFNSYIF